MSASCPNRTQLTQFVLATLPESEQEWMIDHVESCPVCQAELNTIDLSGDTFVASLRAEAIGSGNDPNVARLVALVEALGREPSFVGRRAATASTSPDLGTIRDYRLLAKLGEGGMGAVYKALHTHLDKVVALKVLPAERMSPAALARFQREMRAVGKLHHPNIVAAHDAGEYEGRHFLVMEYVSGHDLSEVVRRVGPFNIADACEIIRQVAVGLQHAHEHGLIHRDIKPSNLMLADDGHVKLLDLGLALLQESHEPADDLTGTSQMMGTADYVAPEQAGDSHTVDIRADIYSLGCTLYKLLTGEAPYSGPEFNTPLKKMMAHVGRPLPDARRLRPELPDELLAVLRRMTAKQPVDRYGTATDVATALASFLAGADLMGLADRMNSAENVLHDDLAGAPRDVAGSVDPTLPAAGTDPHLSSALLDTDHGQESRPRELAGPRRDTAGSAGPSASSPTRTKLPQPARATVPPRFTRRQQVALAAAAGFLLVAFGIWVIFRDRDGNETGRQKLADGGSIVVQDDGEPERDAILPGDAEAAAALPAESLPAETVPRDTLPAAAAQAPASTLADLEKAFVLLAPDGAVRREFKHLIGAIGEIQDGDTIEVHGNGPFQVGPTVIENRTLAIRAADGYRPVFVPTQLNPAGATWFEFRSAGIDVQGCDFRCPSGQVHLFLGGGKAWRFANCRIVKAAQTTNFGSVYESFRFSGPILSFTDSMHIEPSFRSPAFTSIGDAIFHFENSVVAASGRLFGIDNGQHSADIRIASCTLSAETLLQLGSDFTSVKVFAAQSLLMAIHSGVNVRAPETLKRIQWGIGGYNLFLGRSAIVSASGGESYSAQNLDEWRTLFGVEEEGSTEAPATKFQWHVYQPEAVVAFLREARKAGWGGDQPETADAGPDESLVGPGAAYVRALESQLPEGEKLTLRPEPEPDGPIVVLRDDAAVSAHLTLQAALDAATGSHDIIEMRSDGRFAGINRLSAAEARSITIRSAPGYEPIVEGDLTFRAGDTPIVSGLRLFEGGIDLTGANGFTIRNCAAQRLHCQLSVGGHHEVVNCRIEEIAEFRALDVPAQVQIDNSILKLLNAIASGKAEAVAHLQLSRCLIGWPGTTGYTTSIAQNTEFAGTLEFECHDCILAGGLALDGERTKVWRGTQNVYVQPLSPLIDVLRTSYGSSEAGSVRVDPLIYDPLQWRLLPRSPGQGAGPGRDIGADVDRVATTATGEEYQPAEQGPVPTDAVAAATSPSEIDPQFLAAVATLPADDQIVAVAKKLAEVNATAGPLQIEHKIEDGQVAELTIADDRVSELWPLAALPSLRRLDMRETVATDFSAMADLELRSLDLRLTLYNQAAERLLRDAPSIAAIINGQPAADYWSARDAHRKEIEDLPKQIETYRAAGLTFTAEQQIEIVRRKLRELNPGYDGEFPFVANEDDVLELQLNPFEANATGSALWDISPVRGLPELKGIHFNGTNVSDLSPLAGLPLTAVNCAYTPISSLSALAGAPLTLLSCASTRVTDFSPLKGMPLTNLGCCYLDVADLSPLAGLPLISLDCRVTRVSDLSPLAGMPLETLLCTNTAVSDLSPLAGMPLKALHCPGTNVSSLAPLAGMSLTVLVCSGTAIADLSPLKGMPLASLDCQSTGVSDLSPLAGMPLTTLHCDRTAISDLSPLAGMPLQILYFSSTPVSDLSPLKGMPLDTLRISDTPVSDLTPLAGMPLQVLYSYRTQVDDAALSSLKGMATLAEVALTGTRVTAAGVAELQAALPDCKIDWAPPDAASPP